jgi:SAM-dependent methyltransferase
VRKAVGMKMESLIASTPMQRFVQMLRAEEGAVALRRIRRGAVVLDLGAGTGQQALQFSQHGLDVSAIDLPLSLHSNERVYPVQDYDGEHIPFPDQSFDVVFSSNVMEHIKNLPAMHAEIRRVLKPGGECIHIMPTHIWRCWTILASYPAALKYLLRGRPVAAAKVAVNSVMLRKRHGERGNLFTEAWYFHPRWWHRNFRENGFEIAESKGTRIFYTAQSVFGTGLPIRQRRRLARMLGSATHLYRVR